MIKETTKKIYFISFDGKKGRGAKDPTELAPTVGVSTKHKKIVFGKVALREMGMAHKWVRFYIDPSKNIIGWRIRDKVEQSEMKVWKLCKPHASTGVWSMSIVKLLNEFGTLKQEKYSPEIQKYRDVGAMGTGDVYYFIQLKDEVKTVVTLSTPNES